MHFITAINFRDEIVKSERCFGYYKNCEDAHKAVAFNYADMHECYYNYLVIEDIPEGIHPMPKSESWHEWDDELEQWVHCDAPEFSRRIINWGLG